MSKISKPEEDAINVAAPAGFDAQAVPIESVCIGQQKVLDRLLDPHQLKERLLSPPAWQIEITDENRHVMAADIIAKRQAAGKVTRAAVLIPLLLQPNGLSVLLTQRTTHLRDHGGQISFPGGRMDPEDAGPNETALRESEEEIGLERERVEIIGQLPEYLTVSGYSVTPIIGLVKPQAEYVLDEFEVADQTEDVVKSISLNQNTNFLFNPEITHSVRRNCSSSWVSNPLVRADSIKSGLNLNVSSKDFCRRQSAILA